MTSPTLQAQDMNAMPSVLYSIPENAVNRPNSGTNGPMAYAGGEPSPTLRASSSVPAVAFAQNQHDKVRYVNGDGSLAGALSASPGAKQQTYVMVKRDSEDSTVICRADGWTNAETCLDLSPTLKAHNQKDPPIQQDGRVSYGANMRAGIALEELSGTLQSKANSLNATNPVLVEEDATAEHAVTIHDGTSWVVRRLTPTECERLQGFPDGWTDLGDWVDGDGKVRKTTDGARYKALGNSFAVPVIRWIGERIEEVDLWL